MTKLNLDRLEADRKKWADRLLGSYDKFMASEPMSRADKEAFKAVCCASIFAAAAYEQTPGDEAAHAIARSFLLALADPMHPDLDYLRADPNAAVEPRPRRAGKACGRGVMERTVQTNRGRETKISDFSFKVLSALRELEDADLIQSGDSEIDPFSINSPATLTHWGRVATTPPETEATS